MKSFMTIKALREALDKKEFSAAEVSSFYRAQIKKHNTKLNAVIETFDGESLADVAPAKAGVQTIISNFEVLPESLDSGLRRNDDSTGPLSGIPCLVKDLICQKDHISSAGSKILANYVAPYDATVIERIKAAGSYSLGRANCDEFAMGGSGEHSAYGPTCNPWDLERVPGGSSSGSAAAVAAGMVPFALGTETGGSVRQPSSFCNLVGLYPTYGHNSRYGIIPFASSNDQVGPITHTVYDNALITSILSGHDNRDSTSIAMGPQDYTKGLDGRFPAGLRIGVIRDSLEAEGVDSQVRAAFEASVEQLKKSGVTVKVIDLPNLKYGIAVYFIISRAEAASNLSRFDGSLYGMRAKEKDNLFEMYLKTRQEGFGVEVKRRILTGNYVLSAGHRDAYYTKAAQVRSLIRAEFTEAFKEVDVMISPTVSMLPFKIGALSHDPVAMYMADYFNVPNCAIGTPGLSVPCGFSREGLPIGIQFLGPRLSEALLYKVGHAFESLNDYHLRHPASYG